jgi:site-specific DNA-cytosine methylase
MNIQHRHMFSSDCASAPKALIMANTPPKQAFYDDMLSRDLSKLPWVHIYIAGFPCKPYSMLHHKTKLMKEKTAKPLFAILKLLRTSGPAVAVLENVKGISRVMDKVLGMIRRQGYHVMHIEMNPPHLGEPVQRPRYYILVVRKDLAIASEAVMQDITDLTWKHMEVSKQHVDIQSRCLPPAHPEVVRALKARRANFEVAASKGFPGKKQNPRWIIRHRAFAKKTRVSKSGSTKASAASSGPRLLGSSACRPSSSAGKVSADTLLLHGPRERDMWRILSEKMPDLSAADVSQSIYRCGARNDGRLPTVTPSGQIAVTSLGRMLVPMDKLLVHGFPVHRMSFPASISDSELGMIGGNTMHLMCVGCAVRIALSLVDWNLPASRGPPPKKQLSAKRRPAVKRGQAPRLLGSSAPRKNQRSQSQSDHPHNIRAQPLNISRAQPRMSKSTAPFVWPLASPDKRKAAQNIASVHAKQTRWSTK